MSGFAGLSESTVMSTGRIVGDVITIAIGVIEVGGGVGIAGGGTTIGCGTTLCIGAVL